MGSDGSTFTVDGLDDALKGLDKIERKLKNKVLRKSMMFASKPMLTKAKQSIKSDSGELKKAIKRSSKLHDMGSVIVLRLGIKSDKTMGRRNPSIYGVMHEEGSVVTANKGFLRKAFDGNYLSVISRFKEKLAVEIAAITK